MPSALLLWLAASLHAQALGDTSLSQRGLRGIALGLAAVGLWWPLQFALRARGDLADLFWQAALLALTLAMPWSAAQAATSKKPWRAGGGLRPLGAALLLSVLGIAAVSGMVDTAAALARTVIGATVVAGMLFFLARPSADARRALKPRVAAAFGAAAALALAPVPLRDAPATWPQSALWPTLA